MPMKYLAYALLLSLFAAAVVFGYPLFCLLRRFWGWGRLWRGPS